MWGKKYVIPVYAYAVKMENGVRIAREHIEYVWCEYEKAQELLHFDLDKTALYELNEILKEDGN